MKLNKFDLIAVEWLDHAGHGTGWRDIETYEHDTVPNVTVGFVIKNDKKFLTMAPCMSMKKTVCTDGMTVVKSCITKIRKLK